MNFEESIMIPIYHSRVLLHFPKKIGNYIPETSFLRGPFPSVGKLFRNMDILRQLELFRILKLEQKKISLIK